MKRRANMGFRKIAPTRRKDMTRAKELAEVNRQKRAKEVADSDLLLERIRK
jgi:hypothetical protein